ncbi:MAG: Gfo/Idh/MocA family oxidoreductase, partial [Candidatus Thermoplasmatota archaeon]
KNADEMIKVCKENNVILMIDHQRRFDKFHQDIRNFVKQGNLGKIQQTSFYYTAGIANTGSHMFDLLRFLFNEVDWVYAIYSENKSPNPQDPNIDGIIKFKSGILCTVQACDVKSYNIFDLNILGTNGILRITHSGFDCEFYKVEDSKLFSGYKEPYQSALPIDKNAPRDFMVNAVKHLVDCLERKKIPISTGEDGRAALELICAFHESARNNGKRIYLPLKESDIEIKSK